ncbi:MAG: hypothetical protein ACRD1H_15800, partial [Vicinamibacterales bacterium]
MLTDPVTVALTGPPLGILLLAVILAWPISWGLLAQYKRAMRRTMLRSSQSRSPRPPSPQTAPPADPELPSHARVVLHDFDGQVSGAKAEAIFTNLKAGPGRALAAYALGGAAYAVVCTVATIIATRIEFLPVRTLTFAWLYVWPLVLTAGLVAPRGHPLRRLTVIGYFAVLAVLTGISVTLSPRFTWGQGVLMWALYNVPATLLLVPYFSRHVRAVGLLVMSFLIVVLIGGHVALSVATRREADLLLLADLSLAAGIGPVSMLAIVGLVGFVVFGALGWLALRVIGLRYQAKRISDESVTVDAVWLLFAFTHLNGLVFEHPLWIVAIAVAFAAFKAGTRVGFW